MHRCRHLLAALPRTDADAGLIRYAAMLAALGAAVEFRFVHILPTWSGGKQPGGRDRLLTGLEGDVRDLFADAPETAKLYFNVLKGPLTDRLLQFAAEQEADLLLLGHRPDHLGRRTLARRLAMKSSCSVWMVPDGSPPAFQRILVPIDFSPSAADALSVACSLARLGGLDRCLAVHVYFNAAVATFEEYDRVLRGEEQQAFARFLEPIDTDGVQVDALFVEGASVSHAVSRIVDQQLIDLVVMGTRGRSRSSAVLLGSETEQVLIETRVPILAVKHFGAQLSALRALLNRKFLLKDAPRFG